MTEYQYGFAPEQGPLPKRVPFDLKKLFPDSSYPIVGVMYVSNGIGDAKKRVKRLREDYEILSAYVDGIMIEHRYGIPSELEEVLLNLPKKKVPTGINVGFSDNMVDVIGKDNTPNIISTYELANKYRNKVDFVGFHVIAGVMEYYKYLTVKLPVDKYIELRSKPENADIPVFGGLYPNEARVVEKEGFYSPDKVVSRAIDRADILVISPNLTGVVTIDEQIEKLKQEHNTSHPVFCAGGITTNLIRSKGIPAGTDGMIIGKHFRIDSNPSNPVHESSIQKFMKEVEDQRSKEI